MEVYTCKPGKMFAGPIWYSVPPYQRGYVWDESQQREPPTLRAAAPGQQAALPASAAPVAPRAAQHDTHSGETPPQRRKKIGSFTARRHARAAFDRWLPCTPGSGSGRSQGIRRPGAT